MVSDHIAAAISVKIITIRGDFRTFALASPGLVHGLPHGWGRGGPGPGPGPGPWGSELWGVLVGQLGGVPGVGTRRGLMLPAQGEPQTVGGCQVSGQTQRWKTATSDLLFYFRKKYDDHSTR